MKIKSLYISSQSRGAGSLFISMGIMEILKRNLHRVAFFKPIIHSKNIQNEDITFMLKKYNLNITYEDTYGFDIDYVEKMIANSNLQEVINTLIEKFKKLENSYDFVLIEGIHRSFISSSIDFDLNIEIAKNLNSPILNIINAKNKTIQDIYDSVLIDNENLTKKGSTRFATFINRIDSKIHTELKEKLNKYQNIYLLKEIPELDMLSVGDVITSLNIKPILLRESDKTRIIRCIKVAALSLDNFLEHIQENDLIVVPADRSDIILGLLGALYSKNYPNISAIVFPFNMDTHPNIKKLIDGLEGFSIPLLSVEDDTYTTAKKLSKARTRLSVDSHRKIALALGLFTSSVDIEAIENKIQKEVKNVMTPMMFEYQIFEIARKRKKKIVLPESSDERILRAAEIIMRRKVADIILLGEKEEIIQNSLRLGLDLSKAQIINHNTSNLIDEFSKTFYEMRKHKSLTLDGAKDAMSHANYFATMMVHLGYADGMVSGAISSTGETIRPALQIIKTKPDTSIVSSLFFMCLESEVLIYGDCAINKDPNAEDLAQIAISCAKTAEAFSIEPKVAMLSYSTGDSGSGEDVDKVKKATQIVKKQNPKLLIDGPIQYDAAVNKSVALKKLPNSKIAGEANVLIFPDLNTGNNTYKAVQRSSGAIAIGPILQGLNKPINDLSRGCLIADIVNTVAITAIQAEN